MRFALLFTVLIPLFCSAQEQPDWSELQQLLGKPITDKEVVDFTTKHHLEKGAKGGTGSFSGKPQSYSIMFEQDRVSTITLKPGPWPKSYSERDFAIYTKALPGGLEPGDSRETVERKLGSPTHPTSNHWIHGELTIWVLFRKGEPGISELYIWRTKDKA